MLLIGFVIGGILFAIGCLICISNSLAKKKESRNDELSPDLESEETNFEVTLRRPISFLRSMSLPSYEKVSYEGRKCKKMETPPPNYQDLFFPTKPTNLVAEDT